MAKHGGGGIETKPDGGSVKPGRPSGEWGNSGAVQGPEQSQRPSDAPAAPSQPSQDSGNQLNGRDQAFSNYARKLAESAKSAKPAQRQTAKETSTVVADVKEEPQNAKREPLAVKIDRERKAARAAAEDERTIQDSAAGDTGYQTEITEGGQRKTAKVNSKTGEVETVQEASRQNPEPNAPSGGKTFFGGRNTGDVTLTPEDAEALSRQQALEEYAQLQAQEMQAAKSSKPANGSKGKKDGKGKNSSKGKKGGGKPRPKEAMREQNPDPMTEVYGPDQLDPMMNDVSYMGWRRKPNPKKSNDENIKAMQQDYARRYDPTTEFPRWRDPNDERLTEPFGYHDDNRDWRIDKVPTRFDTIREKVREAQSAMQHMFMEGRLNIQGMMIDKKGRIHYTRRVKNMIDFMRKYYRISETDLKRGVMLRLGLGIDNKGNILDTDPWDFKLTEDQFIAACQLMVESTRIHGHPWGMVDTMDLVIGGTRCFPIGVVPSALAKAYTKSNNGALGKMSALELAQRARYDWLSVTQQAIMMNTTGDRMSQRYALDNMVRAIAGLDGSSSHAWNVSETVDRCIDEIWERSMAEMQANPDMTDVYKKQQDEIDRSRRRVAKRFKREKTTKSSYNGAMQYYYDEKKFTVSDGFMMWANFMRTAGVVGNIPIMASGSVEHFIGNLDAIAANGLLSFSRGKNHKMSRFILDNATTDEGKEAIAVLKALVSVGDMDVLNLFCNEVSKGRAHMTKTDANRFLNEWVRGVKDPSRIRRINEKLEQVTNLLMPGDIGFRGADAKRFWSSLVTNLALESKRGNPSVTTEQIEESIKAQGIGKTIAMLMTKNAGKDSLVAMRNQTMGRLSPLTYAADYLMRKNGVTNWLITVGLDTYVTYGINLVQLMVPFSNTMSYLAVRGLTSEKISQEGDQANIRNYQLGGHDSFGMGFLKNFVYDAVKLTNIGAIACFSAIVINALGFDDPEEEEDKWKYDEYIIGGQKYKLAWWMNDLVSWGWPLGVAINVWAKHPEDPMRGVNVFLDGLYDMVSGASVLDACTFITNAKQNVEMMAEMAKNPDYQPDQGQWQSNIAMETERFFANILGKTTPNVFKSFHRDTLFVGEEARDRTAYQTFKRDAEEPGKTEWLDDEEDALRRTWSKNNPLYALFNNITKNHYLFDDGSTDKTGYLFWEMPISTMKDQRRSAMMAEFDFDPNDPTSVPKDDPERSIFLEEQAERLIDAMVGPNKRWDSPEEAIADGFVISYNARKNAIEYCYAQITKNKLDYVMRTANGEYSTYDERYAASTKMNALNSYYYDILDKWLNNDSIPWSDVGYEKLISDTQVHYTWKDSGELATPWDALWAPDAVEKRFESFGNHPTSYLPWTTVDRRDRGFNAETIPNWYVPGMTDTQKVFDQSTGVEINRGRDAGRDLASVLFGGQESPQGTINGYAIDPETGVPTIGHRSYVPREGALPQELKDITLDSVAKSMGVDMDEIDDAIKNLGKGSGKTSKGNYSSWKRYSGGGGSSYNPRIYSNPRSVNSDRAASMYVKQPYGATSDYLRPAFYTKGSREAYRRQDM